MTEYKYPLMNAHQWSWVINNGQGINERPCGVFQKGDCVLDIIRLV